MREPAASSRFVKQRGRCSRYRGFYLVPCSSASPLLRMAVWTLLCCNDLIHTVLERAYRLFKAITLIGANNELGSGLESYGPFNVDSVSDSYVWLSVHRRRESLIAVAPDLFCRSTLYLSLEIKFDSSPTCTWSPPRSIDCSSPSTSDPS